MIVCGKCKTPMASGTSLNSIRKTKSTIVMTMVCFPCFTNAADWQKRNKNREDVQLERLIAEIKSHVKGRSMVRQNSTYKGDEARGIYTWDVYFDDPIDQQIIGLLAESFGFIAQGFRIVGGTYGYVRSFRTKAGDSK